MKDWQFETVCAYFGPLIVLTKTKTYSHAPQRSNQPGQPIIIDNHHQCLQQVIIERITVALCSRSAIKNNDLTNNTLRELMLIHVPADVNITWTEPTGIAPRVTKRYKSRRSGCVFMRQLIPLSGHNWSRFFLSPISLCTHSRVRLLHKYQLESWLKTCPALHSNVHSTAKVFGNSICVFTTRSGELSRSGYLVNWLIQLINMIFFYWFDY